MKSGGTKGEMSIMLHITYNYALQDDTGAIPPRVHGLDGAAYNCLLGFKGVFNVGFAGVFSGFNDQNFHRHPPYQKFLSAHFSA